MVPGTKRNNSFKANGIDARGWGAGEVCASEVLSESANMDLPEVISDVDENTGVLSPSHFQSSRHRQLTLE
jgi:peptidase E